MLINRAFGLCLQLFHSPFLSLLLVKSDAMRYNTFTCPGKKSINIKVSLNYGGRLLEYKEGIEPCRGVSSSYPRLLHPVLSQVILI